VIQQIRNSLVARQVLPKGADHFEVVFHFFGYEDDTPEMRGLPSLFLLRNSVSRLASYGVNPYLHPPRGYGNRQ
jgi:hypothetical protein